MRMSGNTILITGGGSGIGREMAQRFHDQGNTVIVTGRRREMLAQTAEGRGNIHQYAVDLDDPAALAQFANEVITRHPDVNVLINNAGTMPYEDMTQAGDMAAAEQTITTNLLAPIRLVYALAAHLVSKDDAAIVNVSSGLAFVPWLKAPTYSATKAAMHSLSVAWRAQFGGRIEVIELAPPAVQTDLTPGQSTREGYMPLDDFATEVMALFANKPTPSEILVENVKPLRNAEREGRFDDMVEMLKSL